ncbi:nuclear transport factor 2 family protein [Rhodococcus oryzae]|uniref:nuclear transport factor 2 family protein n=1 Tax=Rhodococcus oryzae TaxID=2571143 RepID=UPI0037910C9E
MSTHNHADRLDLADLVGRYAAAVDGRDTAALAGLFTTDAEFVQPAALVRRGQSPTVAGPEQITATVLGAVGHLHSTHHAVGQQVLTVEGDAADGLVYCQAHHIYRVEDGFRDNSLAIRYRDSYRRVDGRWLVARRELTVDFAEDRPVTVPGT